MSLQPAKLFYLLSEMLFIFLGLLLVWVALGDWVRPEAFERTRRSFLWLGVAALLVYAGLRAWLGAGRYATRWEHRVRGGSLLLMGASMLAMSWLSFSYATPLLTAAGTILVARGVVTAALVARAR